MVVHVFPTTAQPYERRIKRWEYLPDKWRVEIWEYASDADEDGKMIEYATFSGHNADVYAETFAAQFIEIEAE